MDYRDANEVISRAAARGDTVPHPEFLLITPGVLPNVYAHGDTIEVTAEQSSSYGDLEVDLTEDIWARNPWLEPVQFAVSGVGGSVPPRYLFHIILHPPNAATSAKPTWADLQSWERADRLAALPGELVWQVNKQCTDRIAKAYHPGAARNRNKEWQVRLSGINTVAQDAERVRLIAICHAFEAKIRAAATLTQYEAIDSASEALWSGAGD